MNKGQNQCLYCYQTLTESEHDYHASCSMKFFGTKTPPVFPFNRENVHEFCEELALKGSEGTTLQAILSMNIEKKTATEPNPHFTMVGLGGRFIVKPPATAYPFLPELEDLTMHLASIVQIQTTPHSLIRLQSGELAFISQRSDRTKKGKLPQEDMCQLTGTLTEDKYQGSMEKIGKVIQVYSSNPGLDVIRFFELSLFCFLTGNGHMHQKNFSLLTSKETDTGLSPAYNLVPTQLVLPDSQREMALSVNSKTKNLTKLDFDALAEKLKINAKTLENIHKRFKKNLPAMLAFIDLSFLPIEIKQDYKDLITQRANVVFELQEEYSKENMLDVVNQQNVERVKESAEKKLKQQDTGIINESTGEISDKQDEDPFSRQLSLFS